MTRIVEVLNVLDLFSGIGGFSLGLERAGMRTVAFCEIDPFCRRVLRKHWPDVPVWGDISTLAAEWVMANASCGRNGRGRQEPEEKHLHSSSCIDVICGGFPCQDISVAGKGAGFAGERSGLWREYARIIGEVRPRYVIVENVAALLHRGLGDVLGDLATLGYDAEWHCIPASAIGAPHRRDRVWIVAYPARVQPGRQEQRPQRQRTRSGGQSFDVADANSQSTGRLTIAWGECDQWLAEPDVGRVAHGISDRVDRLRLLGNAVVPQITEIIGRAIMSAHHASLDV